MSEEEIIRKEGSDFFKQKIKNSHKVNSIDDFHEIKDRLSDFYSSESKSIFLDEIESLVKINLQQHRDRAHGGKPMTTCEEEIKAEKLIFYMKQELSALPLVVHQKFETINKEKRSKVFISYSHADNLVLKDIQRHFKPFLNNIDYWDDSKISPGQKWKDEIAKAISETKVAIFLVSTDFLGSEFIASDEIPPLLQAAEKEGAVILMLIIRPCLFEEFTDLNQYQTFNSPDNPLSKMDDDEKEELFVNLVRQTKRILETNK